MEILTSSPQTGDLVATDATFTGLFILLFIVVIGGGLFGAWFVVTQAISFFNNYKKSNDKQVDSMNQQVKDFSAFFTQISHSQERITQVLERLESNITIQSDRIGEVDGKINTMDKLVAKYSETVRDNAKDTNLRLNTLDDKVDEVNQQLAVLSRDVEMINVRLDGGVTMIRRDRNVN